MTQAGRGLYALEGVVKDAPELVLVTIAELAEHGLASMADVLPVPLGAEPQPSVAGPEAGLRAMQEALFKALDRVTELEAQREALGERMRAGQQWRQGRTPELVSENRVSQSELREIFGIPLTPPWEGDEEAVVRRSVDAQFPTVSEWLRNTNLADIRDLAAARSLAAKYSPTFQTIHLDLTVTREQWSAWQKALKVDLARTTNRGGSITSHATWRDTHVAIRCWLVRAETGGER